MKKNAKKIVIGAAFIMLMICMLCFSASAEVTSGECGENATWTLDSETGLLTISGENYLPTCAFSDREDIVDVVICDGITSIGYEAFKNCKNIKSIVIPESVEVICDYAFWNCSSLETITIPKRVNRIDDDALHGCNGLVNITVDENNEFYSSDKNGVLFNKDFTRLIHYPTNSPCESYIIPDSVMTIDEEAFINCQKLTSIVIPGSVKEIGLQTFMRCDKLTNVTLKEGIEIIGYNAFNSCNIESIVIPASVSIIDSWAFGHCYNLTKVNILGAEYIGEYAFANCYKLEQIDINDSVKTIGSRAFNICSSLTQIVIPRSVDNIGEAAFSICDNLEKIIVDENNAYYSSSEEGVLFNKDKSILIQYPSGSKETNYIIPSGVKNISALSFYTAQNLTDIAIPNSVNTIEEYAFVYCFLKTVHYLGSQSEFNEITISEGGNANNLLNADIHYITEKDIAVLPTCVHDGFEAAFYCFECEKYFGINNELSALGHDEIFHSAKEQTCTEIGWNAYETCSRCDYTTYAEKSALGHDEISHSAKAPTCTESGWDAYVTCSRCDYTTYAEKSATGHNITTHNAKIPTCTEIGWEAYEACKNCSLSTYVEISALGHDFGEWVVTEESTYIKKGTETSVCSRCGEKQERKLPLKVSDNTALDDNTGISVGYADDAFDGKVDLVIEESFDGTEFITLPLNNFTRVASWNIELQINGEKVQPDKPVLVSIPLPKGYNANSILVFHINSETQEAELITPVSVEDGYIKFMATTFSVYTVVDESSEESKGIFGFFDKLLDLLKSFFELLASAFKFDC